MTSLLKELILERYPAAISRDHALGFSLTDPVFGDWATFFVWSDKTHVRINTENIYEEIEFTYWAQSFSTSDPMFVENIYHLLESGRRYLLSKYFDDRYGHLASQRFKNSRNNRSKSGSAKAQQKRSKS